MTSVAIGMSAQPNVVSLEQLDKDFQSILESVEQLNLPKVDVYSIFAPLRWHLFKRKWIKRLKWWLLLAVLMLAIYYVPILNWNASAVGRLVMVQVLPFWDWRPLHNEKCLVKPFFSSKVESRSESRFENSPFFEECAVCENIGKFVEHYIKDKLMSIILQNPFQDTIKFLMISCTRNIC